MIPDYFALTSAGDTGLVGPFYELINTDRAYANASHAGTDCGPGTATPWLLDEFRCDRAHPAGSDYSSVSTSPWYNPAVGHWWEFLGLIGLDVSGGDNSTRRANVSVTLSGGGVIGAPYYHPRTLVIKALAIALSDCGLQYGLDWLQFKPLDTSDPCAPPTLVFYDCCPPIGSTESNYRRGLREARFTEGPEILERWPHYMFSSDYGAMATVEFTITCGNPTKYHPGGTPVGLAAEPVFAESTA